MIEQNSNHIQKKASFHTLGCRLNFSETGSIADEFKRKGYQIVPFGEESDLTFINTCTVTDAADSTCRNLIRKAHRASPEGKLVVAGCYAQMEPEAISKMQGVDLVLGTSEKYKVFQYLNEEEDNKVYVDKSASFYGAATSKAEGHTRAFLKIQDGCNYVCSFCIIPQARGRSRAISIDEALTNAKSLVSEGFKEIVLTGVNIGEYERSSGERLTDLVKGVLKTEGLERLRLSSVEPNTITDELLDVLADSEKFMDHFHIPLQSGSDHILTQMKRKYDVGFYRNVIEKVMDRFPRAGIGADMIVGFPGETEADFNATYKLAKELPLTHFHVFPYSKRKGTIAGKMDNHIHAAVKKERVLALRMLGESKLKLFSEDQVGQVQQVLFERRDKNGLYEGYTQNYIRVKVDTKLELKNQIHQVVVNKFNGEFLEGSISNIH